MNLATKQDIINYEQQTLPQMHPSVYQVLLDSAEKYADRVALHFLPQGNDFDKAISFTYPQFLKKVNATANMFRALGVGDKDVVTYMLPNLPETMFTVYGAETAGIVNAVNPMLDPAHIIDIMNAAGSKILVTLAPSPNTDLWEKATKIISKVPTLKTVLTINLSDYFGGTSTTLSTKGSVQIFDFNETLKKYPVDSLSFDRDIQPNDIASYFHTGGTTGRPKIAQHTHDNEVFQAWILNKQLGLIDHKVFLCGLPWFHVNGVIATGLLPLTGGHTIVLGSPAGYRGKGIISNFWKIVEHYRISFFSSVPTILQMLLDVPQKGEDISSLEYAFCGAAPLSVQLFNDFEKATGIKILEGYGFTEGTCANSMNPIFGERKIGSVGLAMAHHHLKIAILNENKEYVRAAKINEIGTFVARGRNVFPGYKEAIHNETAFIHDGNHQWYNTGDLGRQDADGYFWITGRKKELIIRGGHNIDPKSIEEPLSKHPAVAAVAAVARPDKRVGELPAVYIQLKPNQKVTTAELLDFAKANIKERAAIPKFIEIIEALPLTSVGKIFKPALTRRQIKEVFEEELSKMEVIDTVIVNVEQHPQKGLIAQIETKLNTEVTPSDLEEGIKIILGGYTVKYELV